MQFVNGVMARHNIKSSAPVLPAKMSAADVEKAVDATRRLHAAGEDTEALEVRLASKHVGKFSSTYVGLLASCQTRCAALTAGGHCHSFMA
jgi:hypothetical protein